MNRNRIVSRSLVAAASFSMLAACTPSETPTTPGTPSASPTPASTATPVATPTPASTAAPVATPTPTATIAPSATPTPTATTAPGATPTPSATLPPNSDDISVVEKTTFNGKVYDDTNAPLDGVKVTAKSLNSSVVYSVETTTAGGTYAFNNAPAGIQLEIIASRAGYTTRRRVEVLKSNKQGDPDANRYDFGTTGSENSTFGTEFNALSDRPEVTMVTPGRNASGINPGTSFVLKFSEPMDRQTVVDAFEIRAFGTNEELSVDDETTFTAGTATNGILNNSGDLIWDKGAFNASWNSDDTEVTMTFKEERSLPTDTDTDNVPDYSVSFDEGGAGLKDKSGITRDEEHFKLTDGRFENYYKFSINTDEDEPGVNSIVATTGENSGSNSDGDTIKVRFSERMIHYTLSGAVAGGISGNGTEAAGAVTDGSDNISGAQAAGNYFATIIRDGSPIHTNISWNALTGGQALFDTNDPTHKTVLLLPGTTVAYNLNDFTYGSTTETMNVLFTFTDGTSFQKVASVDLLSTSYAVTSNDLAADLGMLPGGITLAEVTNSGSAGNINNGDTYSITFNTGATAADGNSIQKTIASALIQSGTNLSKIGLSANMMFIPRNASGQADVYKPGDNVEIRVATTVLDPAGNSVDSSDDDASANAS